jgi:hypothetical protein
MSIQNGKRKTHTHTHTHTILCFDDLYFQFGRRNAISIVDVRGVVVVLNERTMKSIFSEIKYSIIPTQRPVTNKVIFVSYKTIDSKTKTRHSPLDKDTAKTAMFTFVHEIMKNKI